MPGIIYNISEIISRCSPRGVKTRDGNARPYFSIFSESEAESSLLAASVTVSVALPFFCSARTSTLHR